MKLYLLAAVMVFALSSPALAQTGSPEDSLNGATLGKSMPGSYSGVPYPNSTAAPAGSSGASPRSATHRAHHRHSMRHKHSGM
jgi:hypothetical protein